jgi:uncharacterized protein (DUF1684 family)
MPLDAADALDLLDWKRQVFSLYDEIRSSDDPQEAWELWRTTRDRLLREHPQSPLDRERRAAFPGCSLFDYDPTARVLARVEDAAPGRRAVGSSVGDPFPFSQVGTARFELAGAERSLVMLWNEGYGGGLFVSFTDETSGRETYPGARYLLDTVKGADLGTSGGRLVLDFNFAYNPSCVYDPAWACPLAPPENRLPIAIRAGEQAPWLAGRA